MSSSISSSETSDSDRLAVAINGYEAERRWAIRLACISPLAALGAVPLAHRYLLSFLFLHAPRESWELATAFQSKSSLALAGCILILSWIWLAGLRIQPSLDRIRFPFAALLTLLAICALCVPFFSARATWFFVEWAIPRTPNPSFARNTLFWEQRTFEAAGSPESSDRVGLVGSSQTYQGLDLQLLAAACPDDRFEKNCLAGFGPMQYPFLLDRIAERQFTTIVCQLSEFDFFREDVLPVSRLRWASALPGLQRLCSSLSAAEKWQNRGELADLGFASVVPLWRQRDHFRRAVMEYWWKTSDAAVVGAGDEVLLADAPGLHEAILHLKENVGRKKLVEVNFLCFAQFARELRDRQIRLIVVEGQVHPEARATYDTDGMQTETRSRLRTMSVEHGFQYIGQSQLPAFHSSDFADAYHLNASGRTKLTNTVVEALRTAHGVRSLKTRNTRIAERKQR